MPKCLLPRQGVDQWDYVEGEPNGAYWDDGGHTPPELQFDRDSVASLGEFDVARTREKIGIHADHYRSEVVVSQGFRGLLREAGILEKPGMKSIGYVPVRLID